MKKNILWSLLAVVMAGVLAVGFAACGSDSEEENGPSGNGGSGSSAVVGTWSGQEYGGDEDEKITLQFKNNGTGIFVITYDDSYSGHEVEEGTFTYNMTSTTEGKIVMKYEDDGDSYYSYYSSYSGHGSYSSYDDDYDYETFYIVIKDGIMNLYDDDIDSYYSYSGREPRPEYVLTKK